jgi:hypothetical protein
MMQRPLLAQDGASFTASHKQTVIRQVKGWQVVLPMRTGWEWPIFSVHLILYKRGTWNEALRIKAYSLVDCVY